MVDLFSILERFPAKWTPVRVKKTRQNKKLEPRSDSIGTEKALAARAELRPVQFFFELMKRIIANIFGFAQLQDRAARGGDGAATPRVGGEFGRGNAAIRIALA